MIVDDLINCPTFIPKSMAAFPSLTDGRKKVLMDSVIIKIDNVVDYAVSRNIMANIEQEKQYPNIAPVYRLMAFTGHTSWGQFCCSIEASSGQVNLERVREKFKYDITNAKWILWAETFFKDHNGGLSWLPIVEAVMVSEQGQYLRSYAIGDGVKEGDGHTLLFPFLALSFMHCKNVSLIDNTIPEKLQRARVKRGKLPLVNFKTLEIKPMVKILREEGQSETQGLKKALHICRGHFKDYSKGNGLFGRDKGMYWWDSQVRGNITEGLILKDYKVSPN